MIDPRHVEAFGNRYLKDSLLSPEAEVFTYTEGKIPIGIDLMGRTFYLEFQDGMIMLVIGKRGSGKTFLLRSCIDRLKLCPIPKKSRGSLKDEDAGYDIAILTDIKNEFGSSRNPVQSKFRKNLLSGEEPKAQKVVVLRPTFFKEMKPELPEHNLWVSVDVRQMSKRDFMTLLRADSMTVDQQGILEMLYAEIAKLQEKNLDFKIEDIPGILDKMTDYSAKQIQAMKNKFKPLLINDFANPQGIRNYQEMFRRNYTVSINMEQYDEYSSSGIAYPEVFVGMTARDILKFRKKGAKLINPLFLIIDEAKRFCPKSKNLSSKEILLESIDVDRRYGVSHIYATQDLEDLPEKIMNQSKYIFVPYNTNTEIIKQCLTFTGLVTRGYVQNVNNDAMRVKQQMMYLKHHWLVIDTEKNQYTIIKPLAPLSEHMESS